MKKILVLGNGFDLAHKLPTKYSDFLEFAEMVRVFFIHIDNEAKKIEHCLSMSEFYLLRVLCS